LEFFFLYIEESIFVINRLGRKTEQLKNSKVISQNIIYSMTRIKRGYIARKRRTKIRLFISSFRGAHSRLTRTITQQKMKALVSAHRNRDRKKRDFRGLWISRINAVIRGNQKVFYIYSNLIHSLYTRRLLLNPKIVAQIAILKENCLFMIANNIIKT